MPSVLANGVQGAAYIISGHVMAQALNEKGQLHHCGFKGELVLVDTFEGVGEGVIRAGQDIASSPFDGIESVAAGKKMARNGPNGILQRSRGNLRPFL